MDRVRIVRVLARMNIGGPAIHVSLLSSRLDPARFRTLLVTGTVSPGEGDMIDYARAVGVEPEIVPEMGREVSSRRDACALVKLVRILRRERPHILHTHTAKAGALARFASLSTGRPIRVHTYHGHVFRGYFAPGKTRFYLEIERALNSITDRIVCPSEALAEELSERYRIAPRQKISVIPLGFDLSPFRTLSRRRGRLRRELGIDPATPVAGIVGRLVPIKNHALFLEAARRVVAAPSDARFLLVGDGLLRASLEAKAMELGIGERVRFLGWRRDLPVVFADLDLLVLSSVNEGTPVSVIEAMASGVPVVATDVGGVRDVVEDGETGFLVPHGDAEAMGGAITCLLRNPDLRKRMGRKGRRLARKRYGADRLVSDTEALYDTLLRERGRCGT